MWAFGEVLNASWQIYGNFIYYANKTPEVEKCMQQKNSSMLVTMFLLLVLGCVHFILYFFLVLIVIYIKWRRVNSTRSRRHDTARVMKSISRVKFSEELFGAVSEENECVICMSAFSANDMISKLECPGKHYYHTACIESWIKQGSTICPMCRQPINDEAMVNQANAGSEPLQDLAQEQEIQ